MTMEHLQYQVKVCGLREPENILEVDALEVEFIGFNFYPASSRYISHATREFLRTPGSTQAKRVGIFVRASVADILKEAQACHLDIVQLHGDESAEVVQRLKQAGLDVIKVFRVSETFDAGILPEFTEADFFLFDTATHKFGGSGKQFNWDLLNSTLSDKPYFLSGGIGPEHALILHRPELSPPPFAVDINSRFEFRPGLKDVDAIELFMKTLNA